MISHATCAFCGIMSVNVNTTLFSIVLQVDVNGDTPAIRCVSPSIDGEPPNTASMCGTLPGSVSVIVTSNGANISRMHVTVCDHKIGRASCRERVEGRLHRALQRLPDAVLI